MAADVTADTQAPYVEPRTGQEFRILSFAQDLGRIGAHLKAQKIRETQEFIKSRQDIANQIDWQRLLVDIDNTPISVHQILQYCQSPEGAAKAIELSLAKAGANGAVTQKVFAELMPHEIVNVALIVTRGVARPVAEPRAENPLSSGAGPASSPPPESGDGKRQRRQKTSA